jgi:ubiquitin carboxyl-terminal hydrolase 12/46
MNKVKAENELFSGYMHQDAHEFLNFVLNSVSETLVSEAKAAAGSRANGRLQTPLPGSLSTRTPSLQSLQQQAMATAGKDASSLSTVRTWVDELFQGKLVNETRCLCCETVTNREEPFYDLSLEIDQNCSVTACLKRFSSNETLDAADKFSCDACACKQEAQKRMRIAKLPPVLCLHLKRFKYVESLGQMKKLTYRVVFPFELKLVNTTDDCEEQDVLYSLSAVVVHMGAHVNHGHYVALVKSGGKWLCFDDEAVHGVTEGQVKSTFGHTQEPLVRPDGQASLHVDHAYILFYQKVSPPRIKCSSITAPDAADAGCLP